MASCPFLERFVSNREWSWLKFPRQNYIFTFRNLYILRLAYETRLFFETCFSALAVASGVKAEKVVVKIDGDSQQELRIDALLIENAVDVCAAESDGFRKFFDTPSLLVELAADEIPDWLHGISVGAAGPRVAV